MRLSWKLWMMWVYRSAELRAVAAASYVRRYKLRKLQNSTPALFLVWPSSSPPASFQQSASAAKMTMTSTLCFLTLLMINIVAFQHASGNSLQGKLIYSQLLVLPRRVCRCCPCKEAITRSHAIAKMTARCAKYMRALKIVCKRKISRRLRKNLHITILSLSSGEIIFEVGSNQCDHGT